MSQKCYDIYEDALYLSKFEEYKPLADSILDKEISNGSKHFNIYLLKARRLYEQGQASEGFPFLLQAVHYGCDFHHHIFTDNFFEKRITKSDSLKIIKLAEKDVEIPFQSANKLALSALYELVNWDQALTWFWIKSSDSIGLTKVQYHSLYSKMINEILEEYLTAYGYPDEQEFGSDLVDRFHTAIIHQKSGEWLQPYYDEAYKNNKISPERYFDFYDQLLVSKDLPQKYGAYTNGKIKNGKYYCFPMEDIEHIDALRSSVCLPPLHVFLKNDHYQMPEGYTYDFAAYVTSVRNKLKKL